MTLNEIDIANHLEKIAEALNSTRDLTLAITSYTHTYTNKKSDN
jgi:hypothetical protein